MSTYMLLLYVKLVSVNIVLTGTTNQLGVRILKETKSRVTIHDHVKCTGRSEIVIDKTPRNISDDPNKFKHG